MASELTITLLRFGFLALLWVFVFASLSVLRRDIFGTVVTPRGRGRRQLSQPKSALSGATVVNPNSPATKLIVTTGSLSGTTMPLASAPILIGRSPACTLVLDDTYASSQHARIFPHENQWWVEDLQSTNGTFVDGERIVSPRPLGPGIQIRIGQTNLELAR